MLLQFREGKETVSIALQSQRIGEHTHEDLASLSRYATYPIYSVVGDAINFSNGDSQEF